MYRLPAGIAGMPQSVVREQSIPAPSSAILQDSKKPRYRTGIPRYECDEQVGPVDSVRNRPQRSDEGLPPSPESDSKKTERCDPKHDREDEKGDPLLDRKGDTIVFSEPQPNEDADAEDDHGDEHHHDPRSQDEREEVPNDRIGDRGSGPSCAGKEDDPGEHEGRNRDHEPPGEP